MFFKSSFSAIKIIMMIGILSIACFPACAENNVVQSAYTEVSLISQYQVVQVDQTFNVALRLKTQKDWHTYWKNPGDSGLEPRIVWDLPLGFTAGEIQWPYPDRIDIEGLTSYGYFDQAYLNIPFMIDDRAALGDHQIKANVKWLACKIECVPGEADLYLTFDVSIDQSVEDPQWKTVATYLDQRLVDETKIINADFAIIDQSIRIHFPNNVFMTFDSGQFEMFPQRADLIDHGQYPLVQLKSKELVIELASSTLLNPAITEFDGVLVKKQENDKQAVYFHAQRKDGLFKQKSSLFAELNGLLGAIVFAFVGGIILNLMPCVFPVLSLKVLGLISYASQGRREVLKHGLLFSLGVCSAFWMLAIVLIILKRFGLQIGWGFQFQSPIFLVILSVIFLWLALSMFGLFEIGLGLTRVTFSPKQENKYAQSFGNGVLATIVATPCTAPFMGTALGYALVKPPLVALVIFTALGIGMSFPYLILSQFPGLLRRIPKPGAWMNHLKKFFGVLMGLTAFWLGWILFIQKGATALIGLLILWLCLIIAAIILNRFTKLTSSVKEKSLARLIAAMCTILGMILCLYLINLSERTSKVYFGNKKNIEGMQWIDFSKERLNQLLDKHQTVFLDFTAEWCLTCKVNERVALNQPSVVEAFKQKNVVPMKADWTRSNPEITQMLADYGKSSIPFYILYVNGGRNHPEILPELLTPGIVLKFIEEVP